MKINPKTIFVFLLGLHAAAAVLAGVSHRPMFADGAHWYFGILNYHELSWNTQYFRLFTVVNQLPAAFLLWAYPARDFNAPAALLLSFMYSFYPIFGLAGAWGLLRKFGKTEFFLFPLISHGLLTLALMGYPSVLGPESLALFWPFFFLALFRKGETYWELPLALLLVACLAISQEQSIGLIFLTAVGIFLRARRRAVSGDSFLIQACVIGIVFLVWRLSVPYTTGAKDHVESSLKLSLFPDFLTYTRFTVYCLTGFVGSLVAFYCLPKRLARITLWTCVAGVLIASVWLFSLLLDEQYRSSFSGEIWIMRLTVIPLAGFLGLIALVLALRDPNGDWNRGIARAPIGMITALILVTTLAWDLSITYEWRLIYGKVQKLREDNPGCNVISQEALEVFANKVQLGGWWFSWLSMGNEQGRKITSVFFEETDKRPSGSSCLWRSGDHFHFSEIYKMYDEIQDLSALRQGPVRIHELDAEGGIVVRTVKRESIPPGP